MRRCVCVHGTPHPGFGLCCRVEWFVRHLRRHPPPPPPRPTHLARVPRVQVTWTDSTVWRTSHDPAQSLNDHYHFASRVLPIYKALAWNASGMLPFILPPLTNDAYLLLPADKERCVVLPLRQRGVTFPCPPTVLSPAPTPLLSSPGVGYALPVAHHSCRCAAPLVHVLQ
jgi:hypothetical protein